MSLLNFQESKDEIYTKMWHTMSRMADEVMVNSNQVILLNFKSELFF